MFFNARTAVLLYGNHTILNLVRPAREPLKKNFAHDSELLLNNHSRCSACCPLA